MRPEEGEDARGKGLAGNRGLDFARRCCRRALTLSRAGSDHQAERLERRYLEKVELLLNAPENWLAVELLAADLIQRRTISGRAARYHVEQAAARIAKQRVAGR